MTRLQATRRWSLAVIVVLLAAIAALAGWDWYVRQQASRLVKETLLTDSPCGPPCWQGITPGNNAAEASILERLRALPGVTSIRESQLTLPTRTMIRWGWEHSSASGAIILLDDTVAGIEFDAVVDLTLAEVLTKHGPPPVAYARQAGVPEHPYIAMDLWYPTRGMVFTAAVGALDDPDVEPTDSISSIRYYPPELSIERWRRSLDSEALRAAPAWPGYGLLRMTISPPLR